MDCTEYISSNFFKITDNDSFEELCDKLLGEVDLDISINEQGIARITCEGELCFDDEADDNGMDGFYKELQPLIDPTDAAIFVSISNWGIEAICGKAVIITHNKIVYKNLWEVLANETRALLHNPEWTTQNDY